MSLLQSAPPNFSSLLPFNLSTISQNPNFPITFPSPNLRISASSSQSNPNQTPISKPTQNPRNKGRRPSKSINGFARSEAVAVKEVFASIRDQSADLLEGKGEVMEKKVQEKVHVVEEEDSDWPLDADVGWGVRASEYFEKHAIENVVVDGVEIDWEGEMDEGWVQEITCLEWERFAFHPSPLVVLVFERYNRAADNWKLLKELEKAAKVYWSTKDRLPPRTIKIDMNIETDLAYALKVRECPQLLFLKGNQIVYREKEMRTADELVHMIAHFYYNAKRPSCVDPTAVAPF